MHRELARKQPANMTGSSITSGLERKIGGRSMREVEAKAAYLYRNGKIWPDYTLHHRNEGRWEATVTLKPRPSWLRRNAIRVILTLFGVNFALGIGYLLVQAIVMAMPLAFGLGLLVLAVSVASGREVVEVVQRVTIRR